MDPLKVIIVVLGSAGLIVSFWKGRSEPFLLACFLMVEAALVLMDIEELSVRILAMFLAAVLFYGIWQCFLLIQKKIDERRNRDR